MSIVEDELNSFQELVGRYREDGQIKDFWSKEDIESLEKMLTIDSGSIEENPKAEFRKVFFFPQDAVAWIASIGAGATYFNIVPVYENEDDDKPSEYDVYYNGD